MDYLQQSMAQLKIFENEIPWMYLDTVGNVTVATGLLLRNADAAVALPFVDEGTGTPASAPMIRSVFQRVASMPKGRVARFYKIGGAVLSQQSMDSLLAKEVKDFDSGLRLGFRQFDGFPVPAKLALLDMVYNLGASGLFEGYPRMCKAVRDGLWTVAAAECHRIGPSDKRNAWTKAQFEAAAGLTT